MNENESRINKYEDIQRQVASSLKEAETEMATIAKADSLANRLLLKVAVLLAALLDIQRPKQSGNPKTISAGVKLVTTSGTPEALPEVVIAYDKFVFIKARANNAATVYLGNSQLEAHDPTKAYPLEPGEGVSVKIENMKQLWLDADGSGDGIAWIVEEDMREVRING